MRRKALSLIMQMTGNTKFGRRIGDGVSKT